MPNSWLRRRDGSKLEEDSRTRHIDGERREEGSETLLCPSPLGLAGQLRGSQIKESGTDGSSKLHDSTAGSKGSWRSSIAGWWQRSRRSNKERSQDVPPTVNPVMFNAGTNKHSSAICGNGRQDRSIVTVEQASCEASRRSWSKNEKTTGASSNQSEAQPGSSSHSSLRQASLGNDAFGRGRRPDSRLQDAAGSSSLTPKTLSIRQKALSLLPALPSSRRFSLTLRDRSGPASACPVDSTGREVKISAWHDATINRDDDGQEEEEQPAQRYICQNGNRRNLWLHGAQNGSSNCSSSSDSSDRQRTFATSELSRQPRPAKSARNNHGSGCGCISMIAANGFTHACSPLDTRLASASSCPANSASIRNATDHHNHTVTSSFDMYQPHPFGVWHLNRDGPTSLPHPPRRSVSASFVRPPSSTSTRPAPRHTRNVHSLGTLPDLSSVNVSRHSLTRSRGPALGYAQVRSSGFPFIMPDSDSEATHTLATEPASASEVGSLRTFNAAASDAGSTSMSRSFSDHPSMRSYEESSVSAKGPGATINRTAGEHLGSSLRNHFTPSPGPASSEHAPSASFHQNDALSVVQHHSAPDAAAAAAVAAATIDREVSPLTVQTNVGSHLQELEPAPKRPFSYSNASVESSSSPIMKLRPPSNVTPSLRDFPVNAENNPSFESVHAPARQRTDSRPTISPTSTSRVISSPAPMPLPLPQALLDHRPTVRRAQGQRAESEVVRSRSSSKPFSFPAHSSAQFTPRDRADALQAKSSQNKHGGSFIRKLIRRASWKGNKSQSVASMPPDVLSPSKTSVALPSELKREDEINATTPRAESFSSRSTSKEFKRPNSLTRRRSKSDKAGPSKASKTSSIFAPFLARDPNKTTGVFRTKREESFGHLGPLPPDTPPAFPKDGLPLSSSSPFLTRDPDFAGFTPADKDNVKSTDFALVQAPSTSAQDQAAETLRTPQMRQAQELDADIDDTPTQRPLSHVIDQTDNSIGMGMALSSRNNYHFQDSLGLNELSATARSHSDAADPANTSSGHGQNVTSLGHSSATEGHDRPRPSIPRIWQGLEPMEADHTMRSTHIDDADSSDDTPPDHHLPANRFDTATTTSSFKTAVSSLESPKSASARRLMAGSRGSRLSLRTQDTPLARHFDQGPRQDSPLADLITSLERRLSTRSVSGAMSATPYHDAVASPSSEFLHLEREPNRTAVAAGPSSSPPPMSEHDAGRYDFAYEDDDESLGALPRETHLPATSHTALVETIDPSRRSSLAEPAPATRAGGQAYPYSKRDTFGGLDTMPAASRQVEAVGDPTRPQLSRFSTATVADENDDNQVTGDDSEEQEVVLPEVKVSEIESHLAAVEAALQDNRQEGSFDVTSLRQRMSDVSYTMQANSSSASMLSQEGSLHPPQQSVNESSDGLAVPGAWTQDSSSFVMSDDGRRITLAPESHEALADAVRSVRRAISSSQLTDADESRTALAKRSVGTLGMESFVSDVAEPTNERLPVGDASMMSEATPAKAAKRRQEGMRDIEQAYSRMLALVQSSAIGVTPSPQMRGEEGRLGFEPPRRPAKHGQGVAGVHEPFFNSPLAKSSTKTDEPLTQPTPAQSTRSVLDGVGAGQTARTPTTRTQPNSEARTSTSLSGLMGMPLDINPQMLRQTSVSTVSSAHVVSRTESIEGPAFRRRPPSDAKSSSSRYSQALSRDHAPSSFVESDGFRKRFSTDNTTVGRASSGGGHTSPSATAKTLGTPRSFATSVSQHSLANMVRRHELEKESLLDTLERVKAENADLHARHDSLTSDLHAEVTRVLELERELERRDSREVTLIDQIQELENELVELRYLDFQLNSSADQTLGSEDGEGSIMDVELPPTLLQTRGGIGALPFSPRGPAHSVVQPSPLFSSASVSAQAKPTHRSTRSEAFVAGLPGSGRSTLPTSRSELPRARPVSLLNGPGGLFREDRGSQRSSQASPLPAPRTNSLLRHPHRASGSTSKAQPPSPTLLGLGFPREDDEMWSIADEQLPEIEDEILHQQAPSMTAPVDTFDSRLGEIGHADDSYERDHAQEDEEDGPSSVPSTIQNHNATSAANNGSTTPLRDASSSLPRSTSQSTVTKTSQLPRPTSTTSKLPTSRFTGGIADSPFHRSVSSRLPRLGLKPSARYSNTGIRNVSNATDKSTASTLSSVYSNMSTGQPPSLGSLPSGNNTMEDEIQAELARLGNPQPYMRYYSPPRSKMV